MSLRVAFAVLLLGQTVVIPLLVVLMMPDDKVWERRLATAWLLLSMAIVSLILITYANDLGRN